MATRNSWGMVFVAGAFALMAIGIAYATYRYEQGEKAAAIVAVAANAPNWQGVSSTVGTSSDSALTPSEALAQDLSQYALVSLGTTTAAAQQQALSDILARHAPSPNIVPNVSLVDLNIATTSVDNYLGIVALILNQASSVKHYELDVFTNAVAGGSTAGLTELGNDADLYLRIAAALLVIPVPPQLASQHLEVVKSVGALSKAVSNMAAWKGDPIEALTDADSFNKASAYVENSVNGLLAAARALPKQHTS